MSYEPAQSLDHVKRGLARFIQQFKNKPNLNALAQSYLNRIQELENACWEVINYRSLGTASGIQIDMLGKIVGRGRGSLNDSDYLRAIAAEIRINRSSGTPEDLIAVGGLTLPVGATFKYQEVYPAAFIFTVTTFETPTAIATLYDSLWRAKDGGVWLYLVYFPAPASDIFTFSPYDSAPAHSTTQGFADIATMTTGGYFAGVM